MLQIYVIKLPSFLGDATSTIQEFKDIKWQDGYKWATLDVAVLYSNIPHDKGIISIGYYLAKDEPMPKEQKQFILEGINFILTHNVFDFDEQLYIQVKGTIMGTRFAPSYANRHMGKFETEYITNEQPWFDKILTYKRYIDDLIFIWAGPIREFEDFTNYLNDNDWGLIFSDDINPMSINYLDITLSHQDGKIITKNYYKSLDCNGYLDYTSNHYKR